ncbi:MAG: hypothetical protein FRX49_04730 [Trebouxia sp. A1-2]|nr:MAG: hypothetical protein FRX49_04730 [Trebouxia sp. A1-2]
MDRSGQERADDNCWFDVQSILQAAASQLQPGELLQAEHFNLFEAMSAVEVGDPKMDAGLDTATAPTPDQLVEQGLAPLELSHQQLIAILDQSAAMQASWHAGNSLAQSVFVCLYMLKPDRTAQNPALSAYCEAIRAGCDAVRNIVLHASVCEEEDFTTHTFGLPLQSSMSSKDSKLSKAKPHAAVSLAEDQLLAARKASHQHAGSSHATSEDDETTAILARLRFSKALLQAMEQLHQWDADGLIMARKHIQRAQAELENVVQTAHFGVGPTVGFHPDVLSNQEAWAYYAKLLKDLLVVCQLTSIQQWPQLQEFLHSFAKQNPGSVARSAMHAVITGKLSKTKGGGVPGWVPRAPMMCAHLCLPPPNQLPGPEVRQFVDQVCIAVQGWCLAMCVNRSRQRRRHRRAMEDWNNLLEHALIADASPQFQDWLHHRSSWQWQPPPEQADHPEEALGPCAAWVEKGCAAVLLQHFLLGFELDLYQPKEFCMIYWYCDYLHGTVAVTAPQFLNVQPQSGAPISPSKGGLPALSAKSGKHASKRSSTKGKAASKAAPQAFDTGHLKYTVQEVHKAQVGRQMCQGLMRVATGLMACGSIPNPDMPFNSETTRYEQRFGSFAFMQRPMPLLYDQYTAAMDVTGVQASDLLESALANFTAARHGIATLAQSSTQSQLLTEEKLQELKALDRIAVQNALAVNVLLKTMQQDGRLQHIKISWDFSHHGCYPSIGVKHAPVAT